MKDKKGGYIDKFLKKADKAIQEGVKKADEVLEDAVEIGTITAKQAGTKSKELRNQVKKERIALQKRGSKRITEGISAAKNVTSNTHDDLKTLKKLGELRDNGIITEKEFQSKKKKHQHNNQSERRRFRGSGFRQRPHETSRFLHRRAWVVSPSSRFSQRVWRIRGGHRIRSHDCHLGVLFARIRGDWFTWFLVRVDFRRRERVHVLASDAVFERDCERGGEWFYR